LEFIVTIKPKGKTIFLVIAISLSFQLGSAHSYYESLVEADFVGHGLKFEAADLENLFVDKQKDLEIDPRAFSTLSLWGANLSEQISLSYLQVPSTEQTSFILRC
jgi:hypothetical protein